MLRARLADLAPAVADLAAPLPVLLCGMVGARQGWREAPYAAVPAGLRRSPTPPSPSTSRVSTPGSCPASAVATRRGRT